MLVKFYATVTKNPVSNRFVEEDIDCNCYISEDRLYCNVQISPVVLPSSGVSEGDNLLVTGIMRINQNKDRTKSYYNIKASEVIVTGQQLKF